MSDRFQSSLALVCVVLTIAACESQATRSETVGKADPDLYFVRGYRFENDPCMLTGETAFTNQFLDDAADLVTCPSTYEGTDELIRATGAIVAAKTGDFTLYRIPRR